MRARTRRSRWREASHAHDRPPPLQARRAQATGFAYFGISIVLKSLTAYVYSRVDIIVSPVVASTLGYLVFGEVPARGKILGGTLLLGVGFWLTREMSRDEPDRATHPCQCARAIG